MIRYLLFTVLVLLVGCSNSDDSKGSFHIDSIPQVWVLHGMSFELSGQILTGDDLPYKEVIIFKNNGDFEKLC